MMAELPPYRDCNELAYYGLSDLDSIKDFVGFVRLCAPDMFPDDEWLKPGEQMNLDRAFHGLELGFALLAHKGVSEATITKCRSLSADSLSFFKSGRAADAHRCLKVLDVLLHTIPSS